MRRFTILPTAAGTTASSNRYTTKRSTTRKRITVLITALLLALGTMAGPAMAHHDHVLVNPSGCKTIKVGHQGHTANDPGLKFHGAAHEGPATGHATGIGVLGQGKSGNTVFGATNQAALDKYCNQA